MRNLQPPVAQRIFVMSMHLEGAQAILNNLIIISKSSTHTAVKIISGFTKTT